MNSTIGLAEPSGSGVATPPEVSTPPNCEAQQAAPMNRKTKLTIKARSRAAKVSLASRNKLPAAVPVANLDDDILLDDVTRAAKDAMQAETSLTEAVTACCKADIDRDDVIEAIVAGGWSNSRAKTLVSAVYCAAGKRVRAKGAGRETPKAAVAFADYMLDKSENRQTAIKLARAALRYLVALEKKAAEVKRPVEAVKETEKN